jgi:hypothetical protein
VKDKSMTTISSIGTLTGMRAALASSRRVSDGIDVTNTMKEVRPSAEEMAQLAQIKANAAAQDAACEKQRQEIEKNKRVESHEMYLSNISDLSYEHAKKQLGIVEVKISNHEDAGMNVHGRYGDHNISDLNTYLAALKDYISKIDIGASPTPSEQAKGPSSTGG